MVPVNVELKTRYYLEFIEDAGCMGTNTGTGSHQLNAGGWLLSAQAGRSSLSNRRPFGSLGRCEQYRFFEKLGAATAAVSGVGPIRKVMQ